MKQVTVAVNIRLKAALEAGKSKYGRDEIVLYDEHVKLLSKAAKETLEAFPNSHTVGCRTESGHLVEVEVSAPSVEAVLQAIEAMAEKRQAAEKKRREEGEKIIRMALEKPVTDWITDSGERPYFTDKNGDITHERSGHSHGRPVMTSNGPKGIYLGESLREDERIVARMAGVRAGPLALAIATYEQRYAEWERYVKERAEILAAKQVLFAQRCREYVIRFVPDYERAARDGRNVNQVAKDTNQKAVVENLIRIGYQPMDAYDVEEHTRPNTHAYGVHDRVKLALDQRMTMELEHVQKGGEWGIIWYGVATRIVRADTCSESNCRKGFRTCVEVTLRYGDESEQTLYVYADTQEPHVHKAAEGE